jgi:dTMP kinase
VLYFRVPVATSIARKLAAREKINTWEAGMDLGLSENLLESFRLFQTRLKREYDRLAPRDGFVTIRADRSVEEVVASVRQQVRPLLVDFPTAEALVHG